MKNENVSITRACEIVGINKDTYYEYKKYLDLLSQIDTNLSLEDSTKIIMNQLTSEKAIIESNIKNSKVENDQFVRICLNISKENLNFLKKYKESHGIPVASKGSELLNDAVYKMRKESK